MSSLTIIRGLPGSGKSTLAKKLLSTRQNGVHLEADMYFINTDGEYQFDAKALYAAHKWCHTAALKALMDDKDVIVSNTFTTYKELKPYFELAQVIGKFPSIITCKGEYGSIHDVPEETMKRMRDRFAHDNDALLNRFFT